MRSSDNTPPLVTVANRQFGLVRDADLLEAGASRHVVSRWVRSGRLTRIHRGIYSLGHSALLREGRCLAALWACGEDAVLSHSSAIARLGYGSEDPAEAVHVSTTREVTSREGLIVHRVKTLDVRDVCEIGSLTLTTLPRTLVDLADITAWQDFRDVADRVHELRLDRVAAAQERAPGRRGAGLVTRLLEADDAHTKSEFERRFLRFSRTHSLPSPDRLNRWLAGHKADCIYDDARLVIELDGRAYHRRRAQMRADRLRDSDYQLAGYRILRLVWDDLHPGEAADTAVRVLQMLQRVAR